MSNNPIKTKVKQYFEGDGIAFGEVGNYYRWVRPFNPRTGEYEMIPVSKEEFESNKNKQVYAIQNAVVSLEHKNTTVRNIPGTFFVTHNYDQSQIIGEALLWKDEDTNNIVGDIDLFTTGQKKLEHSVVWPAIGGVVEERDGDRILKYRITEVSLCTVKNVDPNIPPLQL